MDRWPASIRHSTYAGTSGYVIPNNEVPSAVDKLGLPLLLSLVDIGSRLLLNNMLLRLLLVRRLSCPNSSLLLDVTSLV